jgi:hypothetical protein
LHVVVVLPSFGKALVTTTSFCAWSRSTYWRLVRSWRNASASGDCGSSMTTSGLFFTAPSKTVTPSDGAPATSARSSVDFTDRSRV